MKQAFSRTAALLGEQAMEKLQNARVAIFGLGGVGGYCLEALARGGIGEFDLIDADTIDITNINRQILALSDNVGRYKTEVARERVLAINPAAKVLTHNLFYNPETAEKFDFSHYDYIVDAIDTVSAKVDLVLRAREAGVRIISCMGTGNKLHPEKLKVADIYSTSVCPLARVMRSLLKKEGVKSLKVVYSDETPVKSLTEEVRPATGRPVPASCSFVPSVAGLLMAGEVIRDICRD